MGLKLTSNWAESCERKLYRLYNNAQYESTSKRSKNIEQGWRFIEVEKKENSLENELQICKELIN